MSVAVNQPIRAEGRIPHPDRPKLILARCSDRKRDDDLRDAMDASLRPWLAHPEVRWFQDLPFDIVTVGAEGDRLRRRHGIETLVAGGTSRVVGYLANRGDWWFLVVPDSASAEAEDGSNAFVTVLDEVLQRIRPGTVAVADFSRLVRSFTYGGPTFGTLQRIGAVVVEGGDRWLDPGAPEAEWNFAMRTVMSSADRRATLERLQHGQLQLAERGRWPFAEEYLPDGYRFRRDDDGVVHLGEVEVDPTKSELVAEFVRLGATELTDAEIARRLGPRGLLAPRATLELRRRTRCFDKLVTVDQLRHPAAAVRAKYARNLDVYETGVLQVEITAALPGNLRGLTPDADGVFRYQIQVGPHPAVTPEEIAAARARRLRRRPAPGRPRAALRPFGTLATWEDDGLQWALLPGHPGYYNLCRRPLAEAVDVSGRHRSWRGHTTGAVATVASAELHASVAEAIESLDPDGGPLVVGTPATFVPGGAGSDRLAELDRRIAEVEELLAGAAEMAERTAARGDLEAADHYEASRAAHRRELDLLWAARAAAVASSAPERAELDCATLAGVAAGLRRWPDRAPAELRAALRRTVRDMRLRPRGLVVDWEAELEVGGPRGRLRVQVSGTVPNRRAGVRRDEVLAERFLADGLDVAAVAAEAAWGDPKAVERRIQRWLAARLPSKGLRAALVDCPVASTRRAVWAALTGEAPPAELDPDWACHLARTYLADAGWALSWAADTHRLRRAAVAAVACADPAGMPFAELCARLGVRAGSVRPMLGPHSRRGAATRPYGPCLARTRPWWRQGLAPEQMRVRLIPCGHCGGPATHVLRVPEIPGDLLCASCRRPADPRFGFTVPDEYFLAWEGPRGHGADGSAGTRLGPDG